MKTIKIIGYVTGILGMAANIYIGNISAAIWAMAWTLGLMNWK